MFCSRRYVSGIASDFVNPISHIVHVRSLLLLLLALLELSPNIGVPKILQKLCHY